MDEFKVSVWILIQFVWLGIKIPGTQSSFLQGPLKQPSWAHHLFDDLVDKLSVRDKH